MENNLKANPKYNAALTRITKIVTAISSLTLDKLPPAVKESLINEIKSFKGQIPLLVAEAVIAVALGPQLDPLIAGLPSVVRALMLFWKIDGEMLLHFIEPFIIHRIEQYFDSLIVKINGGTPPAASDGSTGLTGGSLEDFDPASLENLDFHELFRSAVSEMTNMHLNVMTTSMETLKDQHQFDVDHHDNIVDLVLSMNNHPSLNVKPKKKPIVKPVAKPVVDDKIRDALNFLQSCK